MKRNTGFTLIDLMIVIGIIGILAMGILAMVALPAYQNQQNPVPKIGTPSTVEVVIQSSDLQHSTIFNDQVNIVATSGGVFTNSNHDQLGVSNSMALKTIIDTNIGNTCTLTFRQITNPTYRHITNVDCTSTTDGYVSY